MLLTNGVVASRPDARAIAASEGRIVAVGSEATASAAVAGGEKRIDLRGGVVFPGFVDAHIHLLQVGLTAIGWRRDLSGLSREGVLECLASAAKERGGSEWTVGSGWDESDWEDKAYLTRRELDRVAPSKPIAAVRMDGHLMIVNSEGLRAASEILPRSIPDGLVDAKRGEIREEATWKLLKALAPDEATLSEAFGAASDQCHRLGITSVHTMSDPMWVPALLQGGDRHRLRVTVYQQVASVADFDRLVSPDHFGGEWVRFGGVKAFADGSLGAKNAAVKVPFVGGGNGALNHSDEELAAIVSEAERRGWQTAIHAIGDRAIEQVLRVHASVGSSPNRRHRIEHLELASQEQIERARDLGLHLSMQPNFIGNWSGPGSMNEQRVGRDRDRASNRLRLVLDVGAPLAFGSDGMPAGPLYGIHSAVNGPYASQRVTVDEAVECYTQGGARFAFEEDAKGRLVAGAFADLVVLDEDPRRDRERIVERRVERVFVAGECVHEGGEV